MDSFSNVRGGSRGKMADWAVLRGQASLVKTGVRSLEVDIVRGLGVKGLWLGVVRGGAVSSIGRLWQEDGLFVKIRIRLTRRNLADIQQLAVRDGKLTFSLIQWYDGEIRFRWSECQATFSQCK